MTELQPLWSAVVLRLVADRRGLRLHQARGMGPHTEDLRQEADPSSRVTTISPGVVESQLAHNITDPATEARIAAYRANPSPPA